MRCAVKLWRKSTHSWSSLIIFSGSQSNLEHWHDVQHHPQTFDSFEKLVTENELETGFRSSLYQSDAGHWVDVQRILKGWRATWRFTDLQKINARSHCPRLTSGIDAMCNTMPRKTIHSWIMHRIWCAGPPRTFGIETCGSLFYTHNPDYLLCIYIPVPSLRHMCTVHRNFSHTHQKFT